MANFIFASAASFLLKRGFSNPHFAKKKVSPSKRSQTVVYQTSVTHMQGVVI